MLDCGDQERSLAHWIYSLPCHVNLPSALRDGFDKAGPTSALPDDGRSGCRINCRGDEHRAALEYAQTFPALPRPPAWHGVYTTDFSRHGCGFLHSEPLYPGERIRLVLLTGVQRLSEVAWCRRVGERCFAIGVRFVASATTTDAAE